MKKMVCCICCLLFLAQCAKQENEDIARSGQTNFPEHIESYGKRLAKELRQTVYNLNEMGVDYSDAENSKALRAKFLSDWSNANPILMKNKTTVSEIDPIAFSEGYRNLTDTQIEFIKQIINEYEKSSSCEDFSNRLFIINEKIYSQVPEIEQERLFYITATLYYGINEIQNIERKGQMPIIPYNAQIVRVKSSSESNGSWGSCKQITAAVWTLAVGSITSAGETVVSVSAAAASSGLLVVTLCLTLIGSETGMCLEYAKKCAEIQWKVEYGVKIRMECDVCYRYCMANGSWNFLSCPVKL